MEGGVVYEVEHLHVSIEFGGVAETCRARPNLESSKYGST